MRKIEIDMLQALNDNRTMHKQNTIVDRDLQVFLHGNHIATVDGITVNVNVDTLRKWPSPTTKSRLRALGVPVYTKDFDTFIGDQSIYNMGDTYTITTDENYRRYIRNQVL
jgi:hypothetical protein